MECTNSEIKLDRWWFHLGEAKRFSRLDHNAYYLACKAGGAMGDIEIFKNENEWKSVSVPHDWLTEVEVNENEAPAGGYKKRGSAWYYTTVSLDKPFETSRLVFGGVLGVCEIYINGTLACRNFSGYNRFYCDASDYFTSGENLIAVHVNAEVWEGWWYEGAGIYRPVTLEAYNGAHIITEDTFVRGEQIDGRWYLIGDIAVSSPCEVTSVLKDADGKAVLTAKGTSLREPVSTPSLWSPDKPYLYTLEVMAEGSTYSQKIGFRNIEWDVKRGMLLNGERCRIKGICCHQDHAGVGSATGKTVTEYRIKKLKALGVNAYRTAHHAPSEELLEICDRLGMLVMVENRHFNTSPDTMAQIDSLVKLSRNHPSAFLYSLFNEELWQSEERGLKMALRMRERILELDKTRPVTAAMNGGVLTGENASDALDVIGINYFIADYEKCHDRTPNKVIIGTENCPTFATRGVYEASADRQEWSSYGDKWADTFSESLDVTMKAYSDHRFNAGCFVWSGFDYRGEPQPYEWPSIASHWGSMDLCGFEKDIAYHLAGYYKKDLFVHLLPHWNHEEGDKVRVCAFTNGYNVKLYLNGRFYKEQKAVNHRAEFTVPFEKGSIRAVVDGLQGFAEDKVWTAEGFDSLSFDITEGEDMRIIDITAVDRYGIPVPNEESVIEASGDILGVGNGNPNSHHLDKGNKISLFHGKAQIIAHGEIAVKCNGKEYII